MLRPEQAEDGGEDERDTARQQPEGRARPSSA